MTSACKKGGLDKVGDAEPDSRQPHGHGVAGPKRLESRYSWPASPWRITTTWHASSVRRTCSTISTCTTRRKDVDDGSYPAVRRDDAVTGGIGRVRATVSRRGDRHCRRQEGDRPRRPSLLTLAAPRARSGWPHRQSRAGRSVHASAERRRAARQGRSVWRRAWRRNDVG